MAGIRNSRILQPILFLFAVCIVSLPAQAADVNDSDIRAAGGASTYVFVPNQSTVVQTGGIAGVHWVYSIEGKFQLSVDPNAPNSGIASFIYVDANATDDSPYRRTLDPNEVFNMTELVGTVIGDTIIVFMGKADDGSDVLIIAFLNDDLVYLVGQTFPPASSADFFIFSLNAVAQRKYGGGTGEPNDPYQIATAEDLMLLGETPEDYDKHFILTADIDLDPNLPGRRIFDRAVIAPDVNDAEHWFQGSPFTGTFDGDNHTISHLTITGGGDLGLFGRTGSGAKISNLGLEAVDVNGTGWCVGGLVGWNFGSITTSYSTGSVSGGYCVGGLVGHNSEGSITSCYSTGTVSGKDSVGGLVGESCGVPAPSIITASYSTGSVIGDDDVGGLVGSNGGWFGMGSITNSYSTGAVSGDRSVGGLVGRNLEDKGSITSSFWDIQTSGQTESAGGVGKATNEMQTAGTFLDAGWDFVGETANGTEDIWWILEGKDYPRLWWEAHN